MTVLRKMWFINPIFQSPHLINLIRLTHINGLLALSRLWSMVLVIVAGSLALITNQTAGAVQFESFRSHL
jgi:hypothetical protein